MAKDRRMTGRTGLRATVRTAAVVMAAAMILGTVVIAGPARADDAAIAAARTAIEGSETQNGVKSLNKLISGNSLSGPALARALLWRGVGNQKLGANSQAIADLAGAIWLGGLTPSEQAVAYRYRGQAFKAFGQSSRADFDLAQAAKLEGNRTVAQAGGSAEGSDGPTGALGQAAGQQGTGSSQSSGGIAGFFDSLFGAESDTQTGSVAPKRPQAPAQQSAQIGEGWQTTTSAAQAGSAGQANRVATATQPVARPAAPIQPKAEAPAEKPAAKPAPADEKPLASGTYFLQLAAVQSEEAAFGEWARLKRKHKAELDGRSPRIVPIESNDRQFHTVQVSAYNTRAKSMELCEAIKASGGQCFLVNP